MSTIVPISLSGGCGELVCWDLDKVRVPLSKVRESLAIAGLKPEMARDLQPRYAFARACHKLEQNRVIAQVEDGRDSMQFQFTAELKDDSAKRLSYEMEVILSLQKDTGSLAVVTAGISDADADVILRQAEDALAAATEGRTTSDMTQLIKRIFAQQPHSSGVKLQLISVRRAGGVYLVAPGSKDLVDQVDRFVWAVCRQRLVRMTLSNDQQTRESLRSAVEGHVNQMIDEHLKAVEAVSSETREVSTDRLFDRIQQTGFVIEAYVEYLGKAAQTLQERQQQAKQQLALNMARVLVDV